MAAAASVPWSERWLDAAPGSPLGKGLLLAVFFTSSFLAIEAMLGNLTTDASPQLREDIRLGVVLCLIASYLSAAWLYSVRGARRTNRELEQSGLLDAASLDGHEAGRYEAGTLRLAGALGVAALGLAVALVDYDPGRGLDFGQLSFEAWTHRVLALGIGWQLGRSVYASAVESRRLAEIGRAWSGVDLLDLSPMAPLLRQGLRQALVTIGGLSVASLLFIDVRAAPNLGVLLVTLSLGQLLLAAAALLLPVRGVRDAIVRAKECELLWCNAEIRRARSGEPTRLGLADLIAFRSLVESVYEWPLDAPTLRRFALYLVIPLGSWLGGAVVERVLDAVLE